MDLKFSKVTRKGPITIITLSRPRNWQRAAYRRAFRTQQVFDDFSADPDMGGVDITGTPAAKARSAPATVLINGWQKEESSQDRAASPASPCAS